MANDVKEFSRFLKQEYRAYKFTREEDLPMLAFLRYYDIDPDAEIIPGREGAPIDFQIIHNDGSIMEIEVTQAVPLAAYRYRHAMADFPFKLPLHQRTLHQIAKDQFPKPIIEAINRKHENNYQNNPILLVSIQGDYTDEDDAIIEKWIPWIREKSHLKRFSHIFLIELARRKVFQLF